MKIIKYENYIEIIPENKYITDLEENDVMEGIIGNINPEDYKDITDEEAEKIIEKLNGDFTEIL